MTEKPTLAEHLTAHLRWWDWIIIAANLTVVALGLNSGHWDDAVTYFALAGLYPLAMWSAREAQSWRATSFTLADILAERQRHEQQPHE